MRSFRLWGVRLGAAVLAFSASVFASDIALSGTVYDKDNKPLPGVIVSLAQAGLADTTGADGAWSLAGRSAGIPGRSGTPSLARWSAKGLSLSLAQPALVQVDAYDVRGARLGRVAQARLEAGTHELPVLHSGAAKGMRWLRLSVNGQVQVIAAGGQAALPPASLTASLARGAVDPVEQIVYTLQGQLITADTVTNLIQSGLSKWIQEFSVSGKVTGDGQVVVDTVFAWFDGGRMSGMRRARLGYNKANLAYSGRIYAVKSITGDVFNYRVWLNVMGNGNKRTGISDTTDFSSDFGAIDFIPVFAVSNAIPAGGITGSVTGLVNTDFEYGLSLSRPDEVIARYEWDRGEGAGFVPGTSTFKTRWLQPGSYALRVRLTDIDSNQSILARTVNITNQAAVVAGIRDTAITVNDVVVFSLTATDKDGVAKVLWDFGDGKADSSFGGPVHTVSHKYPDMAGLRAKFPGQSDSILGANGGAFPLSVTVVDSLGNMTVQTASIKVYNEVPTVSVRDTIAEVGTVLGLKASTWDRGSIVKVEWGVNGGPFVEGGKDTTISLPATAVQNYSVLVRVTDEDGNVSKVDTARVIVGEMMTDARDGQKYRVVTIGSQTWMAQNLNYKVDSSWVYKCQSWEIGCLTDSVAMGAQYGRLYKWASVMGLNDSCNTKSCASQVTAKHRGLCPSGWHVPSETEWTKLTDTTMEAATAGTKLKANSSLWSINAGIDDYGFSVLAAGGRYDGDGSFYGLGGSAYLWSASEYYGAFAWNRIFDNGANSSRDYGKGKSRSYSLRCLQD